MVKISDINVKKFIYSFISDLVISESANPAASIPQDLVKIGSAQCAIDQGRIKNNDRVHSVPLESVP